MGTVLCPGYHDYIALVNSKGGVEGYKIKVLEIDHEYKVPPAMEAYERFKKEGAVLDGLYGTPQTAALTKKLRRTRSPAPRRASAPPPPPTASAIPTSSRSPPPTGRRARRRSTFAKKQLGGSLKGKKIAYLFYDNPAGKEPLPILEDLAKTEGFELQDLRGAARRASRWARRCSTSPAATSPTS